MRRQRAVIGRLALGACLGAIASCGDDGGTMVGETPPPPATTGAGTDASTSTGPGTSTGEPMSCSQTDECGDGRFCVADFVVGDQGPGDFSCRAECVPVGAVGLWCSDDASCCEGSCSEAPAGATTGGGTSSGVCRLDASEGTTSGGSGDTTDTDSSSGGISSSGGGSSSGSTG